MILLIRFCRHRAIPQALSTRRASFLLKAQTAFGRFFVLRRTAMNLETEGIALIRDAPPGKASKPRRS
ncbi:hypothetical protein [Xylella taiwanensis]|uniref:hypothetical protein n=1 Tax=Xylella taiwanensis TaxID=1444770 RepID=UPI001E2E9A73|nr:hypothetical protein [Xylella taiwanensis]UFN21378.1 hypothetical protein LPH58_05640 [Xylella taiwanensis]